MELSQISSGLYQPRIKRLSNSDLQLVHSVKSVRRSQSQSVHHVKSVRRSQSQSVHRVKSVRRSQSQSVHGVKNVRRSQSQSIIKLSRVSSAPYKPHVTRINKKDLPTARLSNILKPEDAPVRRLSQMSSFYYRHRITPISHGDFQSIHFAMNIGSKISNKNLLYPRDGISLPIINGDSKIFDQQSQEIKKRKKKRVAVSPWVWLCCLISALLLLAAIAGILATLLPKPSVTTATTTTSTTATTTTSTSTTTSSSTSTTSTSTSSTTSTSTTSTASTTTQSTTSSTSKTTSTTSHTTTTSATTSSTTTDTTTTITTCAGGNSGSTAPLATISGATPSFWTQYNYSYVASTTSPILTFSFTTDLYNNYFLDSVSVIGVSAPSIQLLQNPSFENSTAMLNGWVVWCNWTCSGGGGAQATWGTNCYLTTGNCFLADCPNTGSGSIVFLGQSFSAIVGATYMISFRLRMAYGSGGLSLTKCIVSIN